MAITLAGVRLGHAVDRLDRAVAGAVRDLYRHRRARPRLPFQPGLGVGWTLLVWAGPAQIILMVTLGSGATVVQAALAVTVSAVRLFPMVVSVLPLPRTPQTRKRQFILVRASDRGDDVGRMLSVAAAGAARTPDRLRPRAWRRPGLHRLTATTLGYLLRISRRPLAAAILLLTPLAFLLSTARNTREIADVVALALGLALFPVAAMMHTGVDILVTGVLAGSIAYGVHRWRAGVSDLFSRFVGDWHAMVVLLVAASCPTKCGGCSGCGWRRYRRGVGTAGVGEGVATAVLAGVIAQILVQPPGALASVPEWLRFAAVAVGLVVFLAIRRSILAGVVAANW